MCLVKDQVGWEVWRMGWEVRRGYPTLLLSYCSPVPPDLSALHLWLDPPLAELLLRLQSLKKRDLALSPY